MGDNSFDVVMMVMMRMKMMMMNVMTATMMMITTTTTMMVMMKNKLVNVNDDALKALPPIRIQVTADANRWTKLFSDKS